MVPPSLVTLLARYTKLSTSSTFSSPSINGSVLFVFTLKALGGDVLLTPYVPKGLTGYDDDDDDDDIVHRNKFLYNKTN